MIRRRSKIAGPIFILENDEMDLLLLRRAIARAGISNELIVSPDGIEALRTLSSVTAGHPLSLILLDIGVPGLDGFDLLQRIRSFGMTRYTPVVVLSSSNAPADVRKGYEFGANGFVQKQSNLEDFEASISATLRYWLTVNEAVLL